MSGPVNGSPQNVVPQPVQENWVIDEVLLSNGQKAIRVTIFHPSGQHVSHIPPAAAIQLGQQLQTMGNGAKSGLIVPPSANGGL
jgi:hypothetical protein